MKWTKANKVATKIILNSTSRSIRGSLGIIENENELLGTVKEQFKVTDKAVGALLICHLSSMKYDDTLGARENILSMQNTASKLEQVDMSVSEKHSIQFILDSLPSSFGPFKVAYNQSPTPWTITELIARCEKKKREEA